MRSKISLSVSAFLVVAGLAQASPNYRIVAKTTEALPAGPDGGILAAVFSPVIGPNGQVAFRARYSIGAGGVTGADDIFLFVENLGQPQLVTRKGIADDRFGGRSWFSLNTYRVLDNGDLGFLPRFDNVGGVTSANDSFLYRYTRCDGAMDQIIGRGDSAPDVDEADVVFSSTGFAAGSVSDPSILNPKGSAGGHVAFFAGLTGPGINSSNNHGVWAGLPGDIRLIARKGDDADEGTSVVFNTLQTQSPLVNSAGQVVFSGLLTGGTITTQNDARLWLQDGGGRRVVWAEDAVAIEEGADTVRFDTLIGTNTGYRLNNNGEVLVASTLRGSGVTSQNRESLWIDRGSELELLVRAGTAAPGGGNYELFLSSTMSLNDQGRVAFAARLTGATSQTDTGVYVQGNGEEFLLAARENAPAPGVFSGSPVFDDFATFPPVLIKNALGQTAMLAQLRGSGVTSANNRALYIIEPDGTLKLIARTSEFFDLSRNPGVPELAQMTGIVLPGLNSASGQPLGFNDRGELVFELALSSGRSAIVVASTLDLPAPPCGGDVTGDGFVNLGDLNLVLANFGQTTSIGDANCDGVVNLSDLNIVLANFGSSCG